MEAPPSTAENRPSCSSLRDHDSRSTGPITKPTLSHRKRRLIAQHKLDQAAAPVPKLLHYDTGMEGRAYVDLIAMKYAGRNNMMTRCRTASDDATSVFSIRMRLANNTRLQCNVEDLSCGVSMCGRVFDSLQVLAFHLSYAHHDVSRRATASQCLVCGVLLSSAKGKIAHMMGRHRLLANDHNLQCLEQRETVISPLAPAAFRIEDDAANRSSFEEEEEEPVYENSTLQDICDMIVIPEVADAE